MNTSRKRVAVLGGGPAGMAAAARAAQLGAVVKLISDGPVGGRAGWHSLLPSKVWLTAAATAAVLEDASIVGFDLADGSGAVDEATLLAHLAAVQHQWNADQAARLERLGVEIVSGRGRFVGPDVVELVDGEVDARISADYFVVATGSVPIFPPGLKPDGKLVIAPRFASALTALPDSMVVVGGGATGSEFAYLFNRLGVQTTWVIDEQGVLPGYLPVLGDYLRDSLESDGVAVVAGSAVTTIDRHSDSVVVRTAAGQALEAGMAFVAVGRRPDLSGLELESAGVEVVNGAIRSDAFGQSSNPRVYVAGDAGGGRLVANKAMSQGAIAAAHALGASPQAYDVGHTVLATYTVPEIAQVGTMSDGSARTIRLDNDTGLKGRLEGHTAGFVLLAYQPESRLLVGGAAAGSHAADTLAPLALGLRLGVTIDDLAGIFAAHPTASEHLFAAAREVESSSAG